MIGEVFENTGQESGIIGKLHRCISQPSDLVGINGRKIGKSDGSISQQSDLVGINDYWMGQSCERFEFPG